MAPLPLIPTRRSALQLPADPAASAAASASIEALLEEREPYRRSGYPRAGAYDRLAILMLAANGADSLSLRWWLPGPRHVHRREAVVAGDLDALVQGDGSVNALVLVGRREEPGRSKYADKNIELARIEQGLFLQALHAALCLQGRPNRIHAGLRLGALPVRLPGDLLAPMGLVV